MSIDQDRWSINPLIDRWLSLLETGYSTFRRPMSTTVLGESFSPSARKASLTDAVGYPPRPVVTQLLGRHQLWEDVLLNFHDPGTQAVIVVQYRHSRLDVSPIFHLLQPL